MSLSRLQELQALQFADTPVLTEGTKHDKDFAGIARVVDDALADLKDKLGKGGNLAILMKASGASKLDTVKDADGKNVLNQIMAKTAEYKKAIEGLLLDAEILISQMNEGQEAEGKMLTEASSDYEDSSDFTEEFMKLQSHVINVKSIVKSPRWMKWFKVTDTNFATDCEPIAREVVSSVNELASQIEQLEDELDKAA